MYSTMDKYLNRTQSMMCLDSIHEIKPLLDCVFILGTITTIGVRNIIRDANISHKIEHF